MRTLAQTLFDLSSPAVQKWLGAAKALILLPHSLWLVHCEFDMESGPGTYVGEGLSFDYFRELYGARVRRSARIPLWRARCIISEAVAKRELVLVEVNRLLRYTLPPGGFDSSPWIRQVVDVAGDCYLKRRTAIESTWGRKVRQHSYECRCSQRIEDIEFFFREFYVPYTRLRYGPSASIRNLVLLHRGLHSSFLLQVWDGDVWIAGAAVLRRHDSGVHVAGLALHPSHTDRLHDGALSAAYYFLFRWARENGVRFVSLGGSRPNLADGVFLHKMRWGASPVHDPWHHTVVRFYVESCERLPPPVLRQLIEVEGGFQTIGQADTRASARPERCQTIPSNSTELR